MSLNDPQWGKRGNGGPPDLEEIWRNVNRKINELFARKGGGSDDGGGGGGGPRASLPLSGAGILVALVLLVWLASGFYIVDEGRRGVVTRFGKYTETTQPGPRWHLPFPVESVELVDFSQVRTVEIGYRNTPKNKVEREAVMLTEDENIIDIQFAVQYNLKNAEDYVFNTRKPDALVAAVAETAVREVIGKSRMDFALYVGREQITKSDRAADAGDARPLRHGRLRAEGDAAERAAAGQGAGRVRRRGQGRPGSRTAEERGAGLRQRRDSARRRQRVAAARGSAGIPGQRRVQGRGRRIALPPGRRRVPEGARASRATASTST